MLPILGISGLVKKARPYAKELLKEQEQRRKAKQDQLGKSRRRLRPAAGSDSG